MYTRSSAANSIPPSLNQYLFSLFSWPVEALVFYPRKGARSNAICVYVDVRGGEAHAVGLTRVYVILCRGTWPNPRRATHPNYPNPCRSGRAALRADSTQTDTLRTLALSADRFSSSVSDALQRLQSELRAIDYDLGQFPELQRPRF